MTVTAMMPLWTMTLGRLIFNEGHIVVPYRNIATLAAGLVIPLMVREIFLPLSRLRHNRTTRTSIMFPVFSRSAF